MGRLKSNRLVIILWFARARESKPPHRVRSCKSEETFTAFAFVGWEISRWSKDEVESVEASDSSSPLVTFAWVIFTVFNNGNNRKNFEIVFGDNRQPLKHIVVIALALNKDDDDDEDDDDGGEGDDDTEGDDDEDDDDEKGNGRMGISAADLISSTKDLSFSFGQVTNSNLFNLLIKELHPAMVVMVELSSSGRWERHRVVSDGAQALMMLLRTSGVRLGRAEKDREVMGKEEEETGRGMSEPRLPTLLERETELSDE